MFDSQGKRIAEGIYQNGALHGYGYLNLNNELFQGLFQKGKRDGYGISKKPDGTLIFEGRYIEGNKQCGQEPYDENSYFVGFYDQDEKFYGYLFDDKTNHLLFSGPFKNNKPVRKLLPTITPRDSNKKHGLYTLKNENESYTGLFKEGLYHGFGILIRPGQTIHGVFEEGDLKTGTEKYDEETIFMGTYEASERARGVLVDVKTMKILYHGDFINGHPSGIPKKTLKKKLTYVGFQHQPL